MVRLAVAWTMEPLKVAVTVTATSPGSAPAVTVVAPPEMELTVARVLFNAQLKVGPDAGHEPGEQVGIAVKAAEPPTEMAAPVGLTATERRAVAGATIATEPPSWFG